MLRPMVFAHPRLVLVKSTIQATLRSVLTPSLTKDAAILMNDRPLLHGYDAAYNLLQSIRFRDACPAVSAKHVECKKLKAPSRSLCTPLGYECVCRLCLQRLTLWASPVYILDCHSLPYNSSSVMA